MNNLPPLPSTVFESTDPYITTFQDLRNLRVVLYFYPKDNTPGCTLESRDFAALKPQFDEHRTVIVGVSRDSCQSHQRFKEKQGLPFILISDKKDELGNYFEVIKKKSLFAKTFLGIERATFLFDEQGHCKQAWRNVIVKEHAQEVLDAVKAL